MNQIEQLILHALTTTNDNNLRSQAEREIFQLLGSNPAEMFYTCAKIVGDNSKNTQVRQSTASIIKILLTQKNQQGEWYWDSLTSNVKEQIKNLLLGNLISQDVLIMRAGANAIAQIAAIEIPREEWLDIIQNLARNSMNQDFNFRRASITTLGFICQQLKQIQVILNPSSSEQVLGSLLLGLNQQELVQISLTALRDSIPLLRNVLSNPEISQKMLEIILPILESNFLSKVYEVLYDFSAYCYPMLDPYINTFVQFTIRHMQHRNQNTICALQLWDTIGGQYLKRNQEISSRANNSQTSNLPNYMQATYQLLLPQVMGCIIIYTKQDLDFSEMRESSVKTLSTFIECGNRQVVDKVTAGVSQLVQSSDAGHKQASALLFSCLCQYKDKDYICECFFKGFTFLYNLLRDPQLIVRKNTLIGFITLSETFPLVFLNNGELKVIMQHLLQMCQDRDEHVRMSTLTILEHLTDALKQYQGQCIITRDPQWMLMQLVDMFKNSIAGTNNRQLMEKIVIIIMNVIMAIDKRDLIHELAKFMMEQYDVYSRSQVQDKNIILQQILTVMHTCLMSLSKFHSNTSLKEKVFDLINRHMKFTGTIDPQGLNLICAAATCFRKQFKYQIDRLWQYVLQGLEMLDQKLIFKAALSCVSDVARIYANDITDKIAEVFKKLVEYMYAPIDRELKSQILRCFGDLIIGMKNYGDQYISTIIDISNNCFEAVYSYSETDNDRTYAEQLKDALIEMYQSVLFALNDQDHTNDAMALHFPFLCTFVVRSCDLKYKPTVDYLRASLELIFDCSLFYAKHRNYKQQCQRILKSEELGCLIETLKKFADQPKVAPVLEFIDEKLRN